MDPNTHRDAAVHDAVGAILRASRMHNRGIDRLGSEQGLNRSPCMLLSCLSRREEPPSQKELAEFFDISPACVTRTLKSLAADGCIRRSEDEGDQRCNRVTITERGLELIGRIERAFHAFDLDMFDGLSAEEIDQLTRLLNRVVANLHRMESAQAAPVPGKGSVHS